MIDAARYRACATPEGHLNDAEIRGFRRAMLSDEQILSVSEHLAFCAGCRERAIAPGVLTLKIARLQREFERHVTDEELMSWVDSEKVEDPSFLQAHLAQCESCRQNLSELSAFRTRLKPRGVNIPRTLRSVMRLVR